MAVDGAASELAPASTPPQESVPSISISTGSRAGDVTAKAAEAAAKAAATPSLDSPISADPAMTKPTLEAMPNGTPTIQEQEAAITRRVQAAADAVKQEGLQAWVCSVARQKEADGQAAAALEAELAEKQEALDMLTLQAQALRAQAAALEEQMARTATETAAAVAEEQRQAEVQVAVLQRQQAYRQQLEAEWVQRRAAWSAREAVEKEEQRVQAIKNEERARAAMAEAEARREREAAARVQAEALAEEEARRAVQAALEAQHAQEQAAREAEAAVQAVAAQRAVLAAQAQAAAEAEAEMQRAAERAAAAAARALEEQERAALDAERRERELAEAQAWARQARLAAEEEASAAKEELAMQAWMYAQEVAAIAVFQGAVAQQAVMAAQALAVAARDALAARREAALQELAARREAALQELAARREAVLQDFDARREAVLQDLAARRESALQDFDARRESALQNLAARRESTLQELAARREITLQDLAARREAALQDLAARREAALQDLAARRAAALQRLADREQQQQEASKKRIRYENTEAALETVLAPTPADWSSAQIRAQNSSVRSKYDPLLQLAGGLCVGQWQEVVHQLLSLELAVGTDPDLPYHSLLEVMSAAHPYSFTAAYREFDRMQSQPLRLAKVHPGISAWITAASYVAVSQNRSTTSGWELQPVWAALRGRQALLRAAMEAWPAFTSELEHRHPMLHHLVCRGTEAQLDEEGSCLRGLAVLATLSAWQRTELGKGAPAASNSSGDSYNVGAPATGQLQSQGANSALSKEVAPSI
uniref:Uncharacterized protein n=1 Tax=Dunaliella tertiolecta TaxID=3047 RepID=A0A7S3VMI5_DUNTE